MLERYFTKKPSFFHHNRGTSKFTQFQAYTLYVFASLIVDSLNRMPRPFSQLMATDKPMWFSDFYVLLVFELSANASLGRMYNALYGRDEVNEL